LGVRVTDGYEDNAMINYSAIRSITKQAAKAFSFTMDEVIKLMTARTSLKSKEKLGLRAGSFNNYCRTGKVSEYTADILYKFFDEEIHFPFSMFVNCYQRIM